MGGRGDWNRLRVTRQCDKRGNWEKIQHLALSLMGIRGWYIKKWQGRKDGYYPGKEEEEEEEERTIFRSGIKKHGRVSFNIPSHAAFLMNHALLLTRGRNHKETYDTRAIIMIISWYSEYVIIDIWQNNHKGKSSYLSNWRIQNAPYVLDLSIYSLQFGVSFTVGQKTCTKKCMKSYLSASFIWNKHTAKQFYSRTGFSILESNLVKYGTIKTN